MAAEVRRTMKIVEEDRQSAQAVYRTMKIVVGGNEGLRTRKTAAEDTVAAEARRATMALLY